MLKSLAFVLLVSAFAPGAAVAQPLGPPAVIAVPKVGEEAQIEVGQTMVSAIQASQYRALRLDAPFTAHGITIPAGELRFSRSTSLGDFYQSAQMVRQKAIGITNELTGGIIIYHELAKGAGVYDDNPFRLIDYPAPGLGFTRFVGEDVGPTYFKQELVYTGVSKGTVSLLYQEFSGQTARPAFSQQLTYDLADGDEIGFRGARIKVLKATNTGIRYVVEKPLQGH